MTDCIKGNPFGLENWYDMGRARSTYGEEEKLQTEVSWGNLREIQAYSLYNVGVGEKKILNRIL
jgi:hypothetical protein